MMPLKDADPTFAQRYASHLKHLKLQCLQTKAVDRLCLALAAAWATATSMAQTLKIGNVIQSIGRISVRINHGGLAMRVDAATKKRLRQKM